MSSFVLSHLSVLGTKFLEQVLLVTISVFLAILIGMPLGILVVRVQSLKKIILSMAGILQTIPSLALLAFLLPFTGIGVLPAIIALTLYALLPIVRNTVIGLEEVSDKVIEAARGLGFSDLQRLWLVELPLALPVIVAGIRTATVICVGIATLAAFIGAGGLGDFINQGLAMNDTQLILLGAIPAAILAIALDFLISRIEKAMTCEKKQTHKHKVPGKVIGVMAGCVFLISLIVIGFYWQSQQYKRICIASKNFTESMILTEMMAEVIEAKTSLHVTRKFNLGTTQICQAALEKGDIDLYPEYTGTAYLVVLKGKNAGQYSPKAMFDTVNAAYQKRFHMTWLSPFGFNNSESIAVRDEYAEARHLHTISDLVPIEKSLILAAPSEFMQRSDGFSGLSKVYSLHFGTIKQMNLGLIYHAIHEGDVNVVTAFTTNPYVQAYHLKVLQDNKHFFPPYYAAPLIRDKTLHKYPQIVTALQTLHNVLTEDTVRKLNYQVDIQKKSVASVAREFLREQGIINRNE